MDVLCRRSHCAALPRLCPGPELYGSVLFPLVNHLGVIISGQPYPHRQIKLSIRNSFNSYRGLLKTTNLCTKGKAAVQVTVVPSSPYLLEKGTEAIWWGVVVKHFRKNRRYTVNGREVTIGLCDKSAC